MIAKRNKLTSENQIRLRDIVRGLDFMFDRSNTRFNNPPSRPLLPFRRPVNVKYRFPDNSPAERYRGKRKYLTEINSR